MSTRHTSEPWRPPSSHGCLGANQPAPRHTTTNQDHPPGLRGHGDSQTVVFFPPKTPPRHFHHQKVLCDDANISICITLKIINTPVNRSLSLNILWVSTPPKREAPSHLTTSKNCSSDINCDNCGLLLIDTIKCISLQ